MSSSHFPGADAPIAPTDLTTGEPTLDEIFTDPLIGLILRRDRLNADAVRAQLDRARLRLGARAAPALLRAA